MVPVLFFGCCWSGTQKGHLWAIFLVAQEKQPWNSQRIPLNLAMKECLLPRQPLGSGTHQGWPHSLLPSSPQVMQPPRKLSQPRDQCRQEECSLQAPAPAPDALLVGTSKLCGNFPGVTFSLPADPGDVAFPDWLLSLSDTHPSFLHVFS